ncbi:uncharacterized protein METZ01_LOCUS346012 [marine metagenome]|uniref:Uncharacterized protein n=1 Tax=marine metagenome TaxID=408172 RepID=A0A382R815_9ZZZZ
MILKKSWKKQRVITIELTAHCSKKFALLCFL